MNVFMELQVKNALLAMKTLDRSIELSAMKDDGKISREEQKNIRKIRKAIFRFEKTMAKIIGE